MQIRKIKKIIKEVDNTKESEISLNIFDSTEIQYTCTRAILCIKLREILLQKWIGNGSKASKSQKLLNAYNNQ